MAAADIVVRRTDSFIAELQRCAPEAKGAGGKCSFRKRVQPVSDQLGCGCCNGTNGTTQESGARSQNITNKKRILDIRAVTYKLYFCRCEPQDSREKEGGAGEAEWTWMRDSGLSCKKSTSCKFRTVGSVSGQNTL